MKNKYMYIGMLVGFALGCIIGTLLELGFFPNSVFIGVIGMIIGMLIGGKKDKEQG